jgi:maltose alpha-D-glucosyltransferase/alpha-amylase
MGISEAPPPPTLEVDGAWHQILTTAAGREQLAQLLPDYVAARRWFRSKTRRIKGCELLDTVPLPGRPTRFYLVLVKVDFAEGESETYVLPLAFGQRSEQHAIQEASPAAVIAPVRVVESPAAATARDGILYDAVADRAFSEELLALFQRRSPLSGEHGEVRGQAFKALRDLRGSEDSTLRPSVGSAEQSNTSIIYGNRLILKLYRRLDAGPNPELEVGRFLTEKSAYPHISPVGGCLEYRIQSGQGATLAMLQGFVPNQGDGWSLTLRALDQYFERALAWGDPPGVVTTAEPLLERASRKLPPEAVEAVGAYLPLVELLGRRTAELHLALAADRNDPNFAPEPFSLLQQRALYQSARSRLSQTLALIGKRLKSLPSEATLLVDREPELEAILARILTGKIGATCIRCHGDYHLGQILYTGKDFVIIDFEGEPGRSLGERRFKRSALLDVAGMLRSFHYATVAGLRRERIRSQDRPRLRPWAELWYASVGATFLRAYLTTAGPAPFIPRETEQLRTLLDYHVVDKCLYELGYELNNRPDWIQIPLEGIRALLGP